MSSAGWLLQATLILACLASCRPAAPPEAIATANCQGCARPALPSSITWPGPALSVVSTDDPNFTYYRDVYAVQFDSLASGFTIRSFLDAYAGRIVGRTGAGTEIPMYVIQTSDPGITFAAVQSRVQEMVTRPGIRRVMKLSIGEVPSTHHAPK